VLAVDPASAGCPDADRFSHALSQEYTTTALHAGAIEGVWRSPAGAGR